MSPVAVALFNLCLRRVSPQLETTIEYDRS
jgi:hypothetical protein